MFGWAGTRAAHLISNYVEVEGILLPTRRSVFLRNDDRSFDRSFNAVTVELSDYRFH